MYYQYCPPGPPAYPPQFSHFDPNAARPSFRYPPPRGHPPQYMHNINRPGMHEYGPSGQAYSRPNTFVPHPDMFRYPPPPPGLPFPPSRPPFPLAPASVPRIPRYGSSFTRPRPPCTGPGQHPLPPESNVFYDVNFNNNWHQNPAQKRRFVDNQMPQKKRKQKIDKRQLPENNAFSCDVCDRGFKTAEKLKEHTDEHEQCSVSGCEFFAAPKLVRIHYDLQHRTGLASKILDSKADLAKWIAERRKNYPTPENVQRKKEEKKERIMRGEILDTKYFGKIRGRGRDYRGRGYRGQGYRGQGIEVKVTEITTICRTVFWMAMNYIIRLNQPTVPLRANKPLTTRVIMMMIIQ